MFDEIFGEVKYEYREGAYIAKKKLSFLGEEQEVVVHINSDDGEEIEQMQRDSFETLMQNWEEMQHKVATAILEYYNGGEKDAYGPDDPEESKEWWPDIDNEEELVKNIHFDAIIIRESFLMENKGKDPIYILFDRDWGGEDLDDNGVAVFIEDGEVSKVGYKCMAY